MLDINFIIENYRRLSTPELLALAKDPSVLNPEVLPHLQEELIKRGKKEEALALTNPVISAPPAGAYLTPEELSQMIRERMESGESIESIRLDLKEKGIDLIELLEEEVRFKEETFEYLTVLKAEKVNEEEIAEKMKDEFGVTEQETEILKLELRTKGKWNLIFGWILVISALALLLYDVGNNIVSLRVILILLIGIWRIVTGYRQRR